MSLAQYAMIISSMKKESPGDFRCPGPFGSPTYGPPYLNIPRGYPESSYRPTSNFQGY